MTCQYKHESGQMVRTSWECSGLVVKGGDPSSMCVRVERRLSSWGNGGRVGGKLPTKLGLVAVWFVT